ncbi:ATP synthase F1 subunit delta [Enterococcus timonensis]|uniref:ATP synthase F1 subunit delta n=1 Tax=Enterococcus timonensis TaxID=1852364 RepID=UPI0008DA4CEB|nr:ATP synthase F1 subunit delta [Enterococcus timonensis]
MKLDKYMVGRRYGKALFEVAEEKQLLPVVYADLREVRKIFVELDDLGNILTDARLEPNEKDHIFDALIPHFQGIVEDFLKVVYEYKRMDDVVLMIEEFERRYDEYRGILYGTVKSVVPLTDEQLAQLQVKLAPVTHSKEVKLTNQIDSSILGGVVVEASGRVLDGSLKTKLEKMKLSLLD